MMFRLLMAMALIASPGHSLAADSQSTLILDKAAATAERVRHFRGVALILHKGAPLWVYRSKSSACAGGAAPRPGVRFDIGSITKTFTAATILRLVEIGQLSLNDRLGDLLGGVPKDKSAITMEQLLHHRAGFGPESGKDETYIRKDEMLAQELGKPLRFEPGKDRAYSNAGYSILAAVIEAKTGRSYEQAMRRLVLDPIGISSIGYRNEWPKEGHACGRWDERDYGSVRDYFAADEPSWHLAGNGGLLSTPEDLALWLETAMKGKLLNPEHSRLLRTESSRRDAFGRPVLSNSGSNIVFSTLFLHWPGADVSFLLMTSDSRGAKEVVAPYFMPAIDEWLVGMEAIH